MVHIIIESLLSTSANRVLYESLWNLSITKNFKQANSKISYDDQSISAICNTLIQEIRLNDPGRNNFYFSTQIAFGALLLYRLQIDKLYYQVKMALQSCNCTFYEINWLSQMTDLSTQVVPVAQQSIRSTKNTKKESGKKQLKRKHSLENLPTEIDLLEQVFTIPDEPKKKQSSKNKSRAQEDDLDPTLAISAGHITLMEALQPNEVSRTFITADEIDEFGGLEQDFDLAFHLPQRESQKLGSREVDNDQEVPEIPPAFDSPEKLRDVQVATPNFVDLPEISLSQDVMMTVTKQQTRKRQASKNDISLRLQPASKELKLDENLDENLVEDAADTNNNVDMTTNDSSAFNKPNDISSFDNNANESDNVDNASTLPTFHCTNTVPDESAMDIIDAAFLPPNNLMPPPTLNFIRKQKNGKLIVDKQTKIKDEVLKSNMQNYQEKLVMKSPMETFELHMHRLKSSNNVFLISPASRFKCGARVLQPIFDRNLKIISMNLLKRTCESVVEEPQIPAKKRRLDRIKKKSLKEPELALVEMMEPSLIVPETELPEDTVHLNQPLFLELDDIQALPLCEPQEKDFNAAGADKENDETPTVEHPRSVQKRKETRRKVAANVGEYQDGEKWSKQQIVSSLKVFWDKDDNSITMRKLSKKSNRFIAAGIFFELMVLSKVGAVELVQDANLEIANISPGRNLELYI